MAASDIYNILADTELPPGWDSAVTTDGRVFFINEFERVTSWVSPVTGDPVQSGHTTSLGLPRGWEHSFTEDGTKYYIDHNTRRTTFTNPSTGRAETAPTSGAGFAHDSAAGSHPPVTSTPNTSLSRTNNGYPPPHGNYIDSNHQPTPSHRSTGSEIIGQRSSHSVRPSNSQPTARLHLPANAQFLTNSPIPVKGSGKKSKLDYTSPQRSSRKSIKKKLAGPAVRSRDLDAPVSMKGWLHKFESNAAGVRKWKRRFCVISNFCLYTYKDNHEDEILTSILLPSYSIIPDEKYNKFYSFKAEHNNMKTHYFAADHKHDMDKWIRAMTLAAAAQRDQQAEQEFNRTEGDGTDAPTMASPPRDNYRFHPSYADQSFSPREARSPARSQSLHSIRSPKSRSADYRDSNWYPPTSPPYAGGSNEWQVRDQFDGPPPHSGAPYVIERPYTPPFAAPVQSPPIAPHHNSTLLLQAPNADYFDSYENRPYVEKGVSHRNLNYEHPDSRYGYEYPPGSVPSYRDLPGSPHQPVHSQTYRSPANNTSSYNLSLSTNNGFRSEPAHLQHSQYPMAHRDPVDAFTAAAADDSRMSYRANGVPVRGEPKTPTSVVNPPWKRENPQTPTYRPPHADGASKDSSRGNQSDSTDYTRLSQRAHSHSDFDTPPPRPQKLSSQPKTHQPVSSPPQKLNVRQSAQQQQPKDELQTEQIKKKPSVTPLVFQFPVPYKQPDWLKGPVANGVKYNHQPMGISANYNNNNADLISPADVAANQSRPPAKGLPPPQLTHDDIVGKSKEELVLLLIELRRKQSQMESSLAETRERLGQANIEFNRLSSRGQNTSSVQRDMSEMSEYINSCEEQLDIQRPLIQLVDNLVRMSTHQHVSPESRDYAEVNIPDSYYHKTQAPPHRTSQPGDVLLLSKKLDELYKSDQSLQKQSDSVNQTHRKLRILEDQLIHLSDLLKQNNYSTREMNQMMADRHRMEQDLVRLRQEYSSESQKMEILSSQNARLKQDVMSLRAQIDGNIQRTKSLQTLGSTNQTRQIESDITRSQQMMDGLQSQRTDLSNAMSGIRQSMATTSAYETDVDAVNTFVRRNRAPPPTRPKSYHEGMAPSRAPAAEQPIYGVIQKNRPMTVRDVKRVSANRHEQQHNPPPRQEQTVKVPQLKPDSPPSPNQFSLNSNTTSNTKLADSDAPWKRGASRLVKPTPVRGNAQSRRRADKARYLTISSSQPLQLEAAGLHRADDTSDRANMARSSSNLDRDYHAGVIDSQLLAPQKVLIPERYVPDSTDDEELLSAEEQLIRAKKAEKIKRMVASQSLQEFTKSEIDASDERVVQRLKEEKRRRERVLEMRHSVAKEVTRKSKESQEVQKLRSKSQENLSRPIESY